MVAKKKSKPKKKAAAKKKAAPKKKVTTRKKAAPKKAAPKKKVAKKKKAAPKKKVVAKKKAASKKKVVAKKKAAPKKKAARKLQPPPAPVQIAIPVPTMGAVLGAMFARDSSALAEALGHVDFTRVGRYLMEYDWSSGHWAHLDWDLILGRLDAGKVKPARKAVLDAKASGQADELARALKAVDWKNIAGGAPLDEMLWFGQVLELVVSLYNHEKTEIVCPSCQYPYRDIFGRIFHMEREITGRVVPLICPYEGEGQHCPPNLAADSWTRLDDITGQDGRAVRTDGLRDRCVSPAKIGFDISEVPEGGGCAVMTDDEREQIHKQHAGRVPAEPAAPDGTFHVGLAGFRAADDVQIVASGFCADADGPKKLVVVDWEMNHTNSEVTFTVCDLDGNAVVGEDQFITIDWIATTR